MKIKYLLLPFLFYSTTAFADVQCKGTITSVHKWDHFETISVYLSSANTWISMPTKSDESMALTAFASQLPVTFQWVDPNITSCTDGWPQNKKFKGWWSIDQP